MTEGVGLEFAVRVLDSLLAGVGDWVLVGVAFAFLRIRSARTRKLFYAAAILHALLAFLFHASPFRLLEVSILYDETAAWLLPADRAGFWALALWVVAVLAIGVRRARALLAAERLLAGLAATGGAASRRVREEVAALARRAGIRTPHVLALQGTGSSAFVAGWRRPFIVLPDTLDSTLTRDELRAVLAHEIAHIRGRDLWVNRLLEVVRTLLVFHPLVHHFAARYRQEVEKQRDRDACRAGAGSPAIASALGKLVEAMAPYAAVARAGTTFLTPSPRRVIERLRHLGGIERRTRPSGVACRALLFALVLPWQPHLDAYSFRVREHAQAGGPEGSTTIAVGIVGGSNPLSRAILHVAFEDGKDRRCSLEK